MNSRVLVLCKDFNHVSRKISSHLMDAIAEETLTKDMTDEDVIHFLDEHNFRTDVEKLCDKFHKSIQHEIIENSKDNSNFKEFIKRKWFLKEKEAQMCISKLTKEGILNQQDLFLIDKLVDLEKVPTPDLKERLLVSKVKKYVHLMYKVKKEGLGESDAETINVKRWTEFFKTVVDNINSKICSVSTTSDDGKFAKKCNDSYNEMVKNINENLQKNYNPDDYLDLGIILEKIVPKKQSNDIEVNTKNKIAKDIKEGKAGDLVHLEVISNSLKTPIQVIIENRIWHEIGNEFMGNPIKLIYKNEKWASPNSEEEEGSVYDVIGKTLYPKAGDASDIIKKMTMEAAETANNTLNI